MRIDLPEAFLSRPIAHRALHDVSDGRPENSLAAVDAAIAHGFGIEIDVQLTADAKAVVFHDYALDRLTTEKGPVAQRTQTDLAAVSLIGGGQVPGLGKVLERVAGQVPLLVEIKDQDGALGANVGPLEAAVAVALRGYEGAIAVMSFNPHSVAEMQKLLPDVPRGLVTTDFPSAHWPAPEKRLAELRPIPDYDRVGASFISHDSLDLDSPHVVRLKDQGAKILCWTIRSPEEEAAARRIVQNVTFEGYLPQDQS